METVKEQAMWIGKNAQILLGGLTIDVEIVDVKRSYGKSRYLVRPIAGVGQVWVESVRLCSSFEDY